MFRSALALSGAVILSTAAAQAAVVTLDFEGIGDNVPVADYYAGDGGPDFGVRFSPNALAIVDEDAGGDGDFANEPTPDTVLYFLQGAAATLNLADGFETGFSFFYSAINFAGSIAVYDGLDATGTVLAMLDLPITSGGSGDPTGRFAFFQPIGVTFSGTARSIDFAGTVNQIAFDNITIGAATPGNEGGENPDTGPTDPNVVPLPASLPFLLAGLAPLAALRRRRRK